MHRVCDERWILLPEGRLALNCHRAGRGSSILDAHAASPGHSPVAAAATATRQPLPFHPAACSPAPLTATAFAAAACAYRWLFSASTLATSPTHTAACPTASTDASISTTTLATGLRRV